MKSITRFDVLILYAEDDARSASDLSEDLSTPFAHDEKYASYALAYAYFFDRCRKAGISLAFVTSSDIVSPGLCESFWTYDGVSWKKHQEQCTAALIFDKAASTSKAQEKQKKLFYATPLVTPFNDRDLTTLFHDKQLTYDTLPDFAVPTVSIKDSKLPNIESAYAALQTVIDTNPHQEDFSSAVILKDRFGFGGSNIYKIESDISKSIYEVMMKHSEVSFIMQPFVKFDSGYSSDKGYIDIRLIYMDNSIIQSYIRTAKEGDFRCNEHQGGTVTYLETSSIPEDIKQRGDKICQRLNKKHALFALDFIKSNNGTIYFLEGNINPGLNWEIGNKEDEKMTKQLTDVIVSEIARRLQYQSS